MQTDKRKKKNFQFRITNTAILAPQKLQISDLAFIFKMNKYVSRRIHWTIVPLNMLQIVVISSKGFKTIYIFVVLKSGCVDLHTQNLANDCIYSML